jgi:hypothetical protein
MMRLMGVILGILVIFTSTADARHYRHRYVHYVRHYTVQHHSYRVARTEAAPSGGGLTTVMTAAGIHITVASAFAEKFTGFIADIVAAGYKPRDIGCYAQRSQGGAHPLGAACDFDQGGRNATASFMYHVGALAAKNGLRDGCTFGDCGHIEDGSRVYVLNGYAGRHYAGRSATRYASVYRRWRRYASR